jgi:hypothetical protein
MAVAKAAAQAAEQTEREFQAEISRSSRHRAGIFRPERRHVHGGAKRHDRSRVLTLVPWASARPTRDH